DTITCNLYIKRNSTNEWEFAGSDTLTGTPGVPTKGTCSVIYQSFTCSDIGTNSFKWEIKNGEPSNYYNTTPIQLPELRESLARITLIEGNNSYVNRSDTELGSIVRLAVNVFDVEKNEYTQNVNVSFFLTHDNLNYQFDLINQTDSQGNASYYFDPDCDYSVGLQYWKAGITDGCYLDVNSSEFVVNVVGSILNDILQPNGEKYLRGENITIRIHTYDDCSVNLTGFSKMNLTYKSQQTEEEFVCEPINFEKSGYYNCTFNTSSLPTQWYDVTSFLQKDGYNDNSTTKYQAFWVETIPLLAGEDAISEQEINEGTNNLGGWGEKWWFVVNATDYDYDTLTVCSYYRKVGDTAWILHGCNSSVSGINVKVEFSKTWATGSYIGDWELFFNVSDDDGNVANTSIVTFTIEKDDIAIQLLEGNDSVVNRSASLGEPLQNVTFKVKVIDTDKNVAVGGAKVRFYITTDNINFVAHPTPPSYFTTGTDNELGNVSYQFDPDCNYQVGPQKWKAGTVENDWYKDVNSTNYSFTIITQPLEAYVSEPTGGKPFVRGEDDILLRGWLEDDCRLIPNGNGEFHIVKGTTDIECTPVTDEGNGYYSCTILATDTAGWPNSYLGYWNVTFNGSKIYYNSSPVRTEENAFVLVTKPQITSYSAVSEEGSTTGGWGETWQFSFTLTDDDLTITPREDEVNVSLWVNLASGWKLLNSTICTVSPCSYTFIQEGDFACEDVGVREWNLTAIDFYGYSYNTSDTITIAKDDVQIIAEPALSDSEVDREFSDKAKFVATLIDLDRDTSVGSGVETKLKVTWNGTEYLVWLTNYTEADSKVRFYFDPNCSFTVGPQYWRIATIGESCYKDVESDSVLFTIYGQLKVNLTYPEYGSTFQTTTLIPINGSVYSDCSQEGLLNETTVNISLKSPLDVIEECLPVTDLGNGYYNCTWNSTLKTPGYWDIRMNATRNYYHKNSTWYENWFYLQNAPTTYTIIPVNPNEGGWGTTYNYSISINDPDNDDVTCTLYISTDGGSYFESQTPITITEGHGLCSWLINFTCSDIGTDNYYYFVLDDGYNTVTTETLQGPNITKDTLQISVVSGNNGEVNRNSGSLELKVYVQDVEKGGAVSDYTPVKFNVTYDGINYLTVGEANTTSGYATLTFSPDCQYQVGYQNWTTFITQQTCYLDTYSDIWNLTIKGSLATQVIQPTNAKEYYRGENIGIRFNISEDCNNLIDPDYINVSVTSTYTNDIFYLPYTREGLGYYNSTFNSTQKPPRYYDVRIHAEKQFYNLVDYTESNAFWIETLPLIQLISASVESEQGGSIGGWGETWTFRVNVTDEDLDQVQVWLYERPGNGEWSLKPPITGKSKPAGVKSQIIEFTTSFTCNDLLTNASHEFFFNGTDDYSTVTPASSQKDYADSEIGSFSLERDDISISLVEGNNAVLNRSNVTNGERITLKVQINDLDTGSAASYNDLGQFWVTYDGANYRKDSELTTIEPGGYITDNFPSSDKCLYDIGPQKWKVYFGQNCYKPTWSLEWNLTLITIPLSVDLIKPDGESYRKGIDTVDYLGYVYDDCGGVGSALTELKAVQGATTHEAQVFTNASGYATYSFDPSTWSLGYYNATINASKTYYNSSEVLLKENAFVLVTQPTVNSLSITTSDATNPYGWGETWTFEINVFDEDQGTFNFEKMNVSLWINETYGWRLLNSTICYAPNCKLSTSTITYENSFTCSDIGTRIFNVTATDYWNYTSSLTQQQQIIRDDVSLYATSTPSRVDREGEVTLLQARVYDVDKGEYVGSGIDGAIKITYDGSNYGSPISLLTDSSGYLNYNFDPDCSYQVGPQTWQMYVDEECYSSQAIGGYTTQSIMIYGQLKNNLQLPEYNSQFNVTQPVTVRFNTTSDCSDEGLIPNATVSIELESPLNVFEECLPVYNEYDGWYNCTWDSIGKKEGYWSIRLNSSKEYYNSNSTLYQNWFWLENLNASSENITVYVFNYSTNEWQVLNQEVGWSSKFNYTIDIFDPEGDTITCNLYIKRNSTNEWEFAGSDTLTGTPGVPTKGTCSVIY
ncbi:MAG: hypothetical protein DRJ60_03355, partial [Thermoprotei archaeon]